MSCAPAWPRTRMNDLIAKPAGVLQVASERRLTAAEFQGLAEVPAAAEWFANLDNPRTRRAYQGDIEDFNSFIGISSPDQFRAVTRAHVLAWRRQLEQRGRGRGDDPAQAWRRWPACSITCLNAMPSTGGNPVRWGERVRRSKVTKAKHRR